MVISFLENKCIFIFISPSFKYLKTVSSVTTLNAGGLQGSVSEIPLFVFSHSPLASASALPQGLHTLKSILLSLFSVHFHWLDSHFSPYYCIHSYILSLQSLRSQSMSPLQGCVTDALVWVRSVFPSSHLAHCTCI